MSDENPIQFTMRSLIGRSTFASLGLLCSGLVAAQVNLAQSPLFVSKTVTPSIMIALDDSGSMDAEILLRSNDGAAWWHTGNRSFAGLGRFDNLQIGAVNYNEAGDQNATWKKYIYLFPNGIGLTSGRRAYNDAANDHYAVPPLPLYAYTRSPSYNSSYFDPAVQYTPWPSLGGFTFVNSNPIAARTDPVFPTTGVAATFNLTAVVESTAANNVFRLHQGMTVPAGIRNAPEGGAWTTLAYVATNDNNVNNRRAISYFPAQFYLDTNTSVDDCFGYDPAKISTTGRAPNGLTVLNGFEIRPENFRDRCGRTATQNYDSAIQNFANWFTYYRKRHAAARNAIGVAFETITDFRVGLYRINSRPSATSPLTMRNLLLPAERSAFFDLAYRSIEQGGTPNREAVHAMRSQLARTDANAPIQLQCQKNFGVLITDGFANPTVISGVGNRDGSMPVPFADSFSGTLADIAAGLYLDNPRPDLPLGKVPVPVECAAAGASLRLDCNPNLHLNLFAISLGAPGNIFNVNAAATADPFANPPQWVNPTATRSPQQIDDLWHATLNSRGDFLSVDVPSALGESFRKILESIRARVDSSGGSAAASSAVLQADSLIYNAQFRSSDWSGDLLAQELNDSGIPSGLKWSAETLLSLQNPGVRRIFTMQTDGTAVSLSAANLDSAQTAALAVNPSGAPATAATAANRVDWVRGEESTELRSRTFVSASGSTVRRLGDIIGSDPQFVSRKDFGFSLLPSLAGGASYQSFRTSTDYSVRPNMLLVGSNNGLFHAFNAIDGNELFAYLPSEFLAPKPGAPAGTHAQINDLMRPDYTHRFFVDGSAVVSDAYIAGAWKTVAVGSLGAGGRTVFALDVTNPNTFDASKVLWEFNYSDNPCVASPDGLSGSKSCRDIGEGITKPKIVRLATGRWAAVFGNGANSFDHRARLLVVDLETGRLLYNLLTPDGASVSTPNGLSPVETTDWPVNQLNLANVYAGDLLGNLWRFNFASATPSVSRLFTAVDAAAARQPITARPSLALRPGSTSQLVVVFGTGSFTRQGDDSTAAAAKVQSLYGVFDTAVTNPTPAVRADLQAQTITSNSAPATLGAISYATGDLRFVSQNAILSSQRGWRIDLPVLGERVISEATFPSGALINRVRFTTLIPDNDPCGSGRRGVVMDISLATGSRFDTAVFDLSGDGIFNASDTVGGINVSGVGGSTGERLTVIRQPGVSLDNLYGGDGSKLTSSLNSSGVSGRQSWRQLR